jgi:cytochrome c556
MNRKSLLLSAVAAVSLFVGSAVAQTPPSPADSAVVYRKAMYQVMYNNWVKVLLASTGKMPFEAKVVQTRATRANFVAQMIHEGFGPESVEGKPTRAKPELWANKADFDMLMGNWRKSMTALEAASKTGKIDKVAAAAGASRDACKACHDKYRAE